MITQHYATVLSGDGARAGGALRGLDPQGPDGL